jgi:hypothetical protein
VKSPSRKQSRRGTRQFLPQAFKLLRDGQTLVA